MANLYSRTRPRFGLQCPSRFPGLYFLRQSQRLTRPASARMKHSKYGQTCTRLEEHRDSLYSPLGLPRKLLTATKRKKIPQKRFLITQSRLNSGRREEAPSTRLVRSPRKPIFSHNKVKAIRRSRYKKNF